MLLLAFQAQAKVSTPPVKVNEAQHMKGHHSQDSNACRDYMAVFLQAQENVRKSLRPPGLHNLW